METEQCKIFKTPDNAFVIMDAEPKESGGTAKVYYGIRRRIGQYMDEDVEVAIKEFFLSDYSWIDTKKKIIHLYTKRVSDPVKENIKKLYKTFTEEAERIVTVNHPNIVKVYNFINEMDEINDRGTGYLIMERIKGETIKDFITNKGAFSSFSEVWGYFYGICSAIKEVHEKGIIHRDLTPRNIMIEYNNEDSNEGIKRFRIIDFGNSKIAAKGKTTFVRGISEGFTSPEMYKDDAETTKLVDIYSMGAILYYILTGDIPRDSKDNKNVLDTDKLNNLNSSVAAVIKKAMAIDPMNRYQDMGEYIMACKMAVEAEKKMFFDSRAIINIMPYITLGGLKALGGQLTITVPLDDDTLESEIVEESGLSWKNFLGDNDLKPDFQVGKLIFKRVTIKAEDDAGKYKLIVQ